MSSLVIPDRGLLPYFRGRKEILQTFKDYLEHYKKEKSGTTFLIQGAPGAGKTALLDKISSKASKKDWAVAKIRIKDLYSPISMAQSLGKSYTIAKEYSAKVGIQFFEGGRVRNLAGHASVEQILEHLSPENGLVLVLDEAQRLRNIPDGSDNKISAGDTLDMIHNGDVGKPVMLLAAGLGTTDRAFNSLGISRFVKNCTIQLGALDKKSERAVIQDWLIEEGKAIGHPNAWIDAIVNETHGWPQHIISYRILNQH